MQLISVDDKIAKKRNQTKFVGEATANGNETALIEFEHLWTLRKLDNLARLLPYIFRRALWIPTNIHSWCTPSDFFLLWPKTDWTLGSKGIIAGRCQVTSEPTIFSVKLRILFLICFPPKRTSNVIVWISFVFVLCRTFIIFLLKRMRVKSLSVHRQYTLYYKVFWFTLRYYYNINSIWLFVQLFLAVRRADE